MTLQNARAKYGELYKAAEKGTVERSAYYHIYLILLHNTTRKNAGVKLRGLIEAVADDQKVICNKALEELI